MEIGLEKHHHVHLWGPVCDVLQFECREDHLLELIIDEIEERSPSQQVCNDLESLSCIGNERQVGEQGTGQNVESVGECNDVVEAGGDSGENVEERECGEDYSHANEQVETHGQDENVKIDGQGNQLGNGSGTEGLSVLDLAVLAYKQERLQAHKAKISVIVSTGKPKRQQYKATKVVRSRNTGPNPPSIHKEAGEDTEDEVKSKMEGTSESPEGSELILARGGALDSGVDVPEVVMNCDDGADEHGVRDQHDHGSDPKENTTVLLKGDIEPKDGNEDTSDDAGVEKPTSNCRATPVLSVTNKIEVNAEDKLDGVQPGGSGTLSMQISSLRDPLEETASRLNVEDSPVGDSAISGSLSDQGDGQEQELVINEAAQEFLGVVDVQRSNDGEEMKEKRSSEVPCGPGFMDENVNGMMQPPEGVGAANRVLSAHQECCQEEQTKKRFEAICSSHFTGEFQGDSAIGPPCRRADGVEPADQPHDRFHPEAQQSSTLGHDLEAWPVVSRKLPGEAPTKRNVRSLLEVDRWKDWDLENGDVCSWPKTPDSAPGDLVQVSDTDSIQSWTSLKGEKRPHEGTNENLSPGDGVKTLSWKRQGIESPQQCERACNDGPTQTTRGRKPLKICSPAFTSSPTPRVNTNLSLPQINFPSIFTFSSLVNMRDFTPSSARWDETSQSSYLMEVLLQKSRASIMHWDSLRNESEWDENPKHRILHLIGHPEHPEVDDIIQDAVAGSTDWNLTKSCSQQLKMDDSSCSGYGFLSSRPSSCHQSGLKMASIPNGPIPRWNLLWTWSTRVPIPYGNLLVWQRVNHYPQSRNLTRKDLFMKNLSRFQAVYPMATNPASRFNIHPVTFTLPKEYAQLVEAFSMIKDWRNLEGEHQDCPSTWIVKPVGMSRGRGIHLVQHPHEVSLGESLVVQKYVTNPLLVGGYKFDLRIYVLVTSFNPLEAWIYKEGFARLATEKFTLQEEELGNKFVHLTNVNIQNSTDWRTVRSDASPDNPFQFTIAPDSSKMLLSDLWRLLEREAIDENSIWNKCKEAIVTALFVAQVGIDHQVNSFELFGFDLLIDSSLKVWVLEANSSPSLDCPTQADKKMKLQMVRDVLQLVNPIKLNWKAIQDMLDRQIKPLSSSKRDSKVDELTGGFAKNLQIILYGHSPRKYGEQPRNMSSFEQLAPSEALNALQNFKKPRIQSSK